MKKRSLLFIMFSILLNSCVQDANYSVPEIHCDTTEIALTNTIQQIKDMAGFGLTEFTDELVIEGYVVSSDAAGNIYKSISIQDAVENPLAGIRIAVDQTNTYTQYPVGRKVFVKLKGLAIGYSGGTLEIGKAAGAEIVRIPNTEVSQHIIRSCETFEIVPKKVQILELNNDLVDVLVQFENVQFRTEDFGKAYAEVNTTNSVDRIVSQVSEDCALLSEMTLRNSGFSNFKSNELPQGRGEIMGVLTKYYSQYQLLLRHIEDVDLTEQHCGIGSALQPTISFQQILDLYKGTRVEFGVAVPYIIEGYIISSDREGNFRNALFVQDAVENPLGGIQILHDEENLFEQFRIGDRVLVKLNRLYLDSVNGVLTLGFADGESVGAIEDETFESFVVQTHENFEIIPLSKTLSELSATLCQNILIELKEVQLIQEELGNAFAFYSGTNNGVRTVETCGVLQRMTVFTEGTASFASTKFPDGKGTITGVLYRVDTKLQLQPRFLEDAVLDAERELCPVIVPKIIITEIADPENSTGARFVELYNAGIHAIALDGWKLNKYTNGALVKTSIELSGHILYPDNFLVVSNSGFESVFGMQSTLVSSTISGNGDDMYELEDSIGAVQDVYGVLGLDGTGSDWEYTDGRAVRNYNVTTPTARFAIEEWTIFSTDQQAPLDFGPFER